MEMSAFVGFLPFPESCVSDRVLPMIDDRRTAIHTMAHQCESKFCPGHVVCFDAIVESDPGWGRGGRGYMGEHESGIHIVI